MSKTGHSRERGNKCNKYQSSREHRPCRERVSSDFQANFSLSLSLSLSLSSALSLSLSLALFPVRAASRSGSFCRQAIISVRSEIRRHQSADRGGRRPRLAVARRCGPPAPDGRHGSPHGSSPAVLLQSSIVPGNSFFVCVEPRSAFGHGVAAPSPVHRLCTRSYVKKILCTFGRPRRLRSRERGSRASTRRRIDRTTFQGPRNNSRIFEQDSRLV